MRTRIQLGAVALLLLQGNGVEALCTATWTGPGNTWNNVTNWGSVCVPQAAGDSATFTSALPTTIDLVSFNPTLTALNFNPTGSYTLNATSGGSFTFDPDGGSNANVSVLTGTQTINAPIAFNGDTVFTVDGTLNLNGSLSDNDTSTVTLTGIGTFNLNTTFIPSRILGEVLIAGANVNNLGELLAFDVEMTSGLLDNSGLIEALDMGITGAAVTNEAGATMGAFLVVDLSSCAVANFGSIEGGQIQGDGVALSNENGADFGNNANSITFIRSAISNTNGSTFGTNVTNIIRIQDSAMSNDNSNFGGGSRDISIVNSAVVGTNFAELGPNAFLFQIAGSTVSIDGTSVLGPTQLFITNDSTLVDNGTVFLTNNLNLPQGSTILGSGFFKGNNYTIRNRGLVVPGDFTHVGTLTLDPSHYVQNSTGTLLINVGDGVASKLVADTASLDGLLEVNALPNFSLDGSDGVFTIVLADGGVGGTFSKVEFTNLPPGFTFDVIYDPTEVLLGILPPITEVFGNFNYMIFSAINQVNFYLFKHLNWMKERFFCACPGQCVPNLINAYVVPLGSVGHVNQRKTSRGFEYDTVGVMGGADFLFARSGFGFEIDYQHQFSRNRRLFANVDNDHFHYTAYATYAPIYPLSFTLLLGGGDDWFQTNRFTPLKADIAHASSSARTFDALFGADYTFCFEGLNVTPLVAVQYMNAYFKEYTETRAGFFNNVIDAIQFDSFRSVVGFEADYCFQVKGYTIAPSINFAWQREYRDRERNYGLTNLFTKQSQEIILPRGDRNIYLAGADVDFILNDQFGIDLGYEFEGNQRFSNHFFTLTLNAEF